MGLTLTAIPQPILPVPNKPVSFESSWGDRRVLTLIMSPSMIHLKTNFNKVVSAFKWVREKRD
ncbi:uncharacterized protein G2W53_005407 [Senna tora]|uniref:Uncharacterized protein n=1 Tax=Senna tora TaxID=362788 RepID=A0A835CDN2_9FABA|nr:uncharacterized protein G2W53_005407 [Senna tora]